MAGLWDALKQYIGDALPGGALNPETQPVATRANYLSGILDPASQVSQDAQNWHKRTQNGLMDQLAGRDTPEAEQAYQTMMQAAGMAPVGMIAWHGSPHKFDKFSLDKIGTGEGAQAYGHGLYLAENPGVASEYKTALSNPEIVFPNGKRLSSVPDGTPIGMAKAWLEDAFVNRSSAPYQYASKGIRDLMQYEKDPSASQKALEILGKLEGKGATMDVGGNLYKTDIPDEAVARFLDWDKPLSQQAPEVKNVIKKSDFYKSAKDRFKETGQWYDDPSQKTGEGLLKYLRSGTSDVAGSYGGVLAEDYLRQQGIPGIRYLDGGSRGTGTGTSNFVAFDPELIRILERNGQPTGLQPWKPGEWKR